MPSSCSPTLHRTFDGRRLELLQAREDRYAELAAGGTLDFLAETKDVREDELAGRAAGAGPGGPPGRDHRPHRPQDDDQRAELRAPRSGSPTSRTPTRPLWENVVDGQLNLRDAIDRHDRLHLARGQELRARATELATIVVRPARLAPAGEAHHWSTASRCRAALFDFGLYFFHYGQRQIDAGQGPYFYLPKMETHLEARLWNDVFVLAQERLGIPQRHDPGHRADRDLPGGVRDGGDPLRAARALRRA